MTDKPGSAKPGCPKLTYFNFRGRGELARMCFAVANKQFTDDRVELRDWPAKKATTEFGQLPILELDGGKTKLYQSRAINYLVAAQCGLAGKDDLEKAKCMFYLDCVTDMTDGIYGIPFMPPPAQAAKIKDICEGTGKNWREMLEKHCKTCIGKSGYLVGESLTVADLAFLDRWDRCEDLCGMKNPLEACPTLAAHRKFIMSLDPVKNYYAKRPNPPTGPPAGAPAGAPPGSASKK